MVRVRTPAVDPDDMYLHLGLNLLKYWIANDRFILSFIRVRELLEQKKSIRVTATSLK